MLILEANFKTKKDVTNPKKINSPLTLLINEIFLNPNNQEAIDILTYSVRKTPQEVWKVRTRKNLECTTHLNLLTLARSSDDISQESYDKITCIINHLSQENPQGQQHQQKEKLSNNSNTTLDDHKATNNPHSFYQPVSQSSTAQDSQNESVDKRDSFEKRNTHNSVGSVPRW